MQPGKPEGVDVARKPKNEPSPSTAPEAPKPVEKPPANALGVLLRLEKKLEAFERALMTSRQLAPGAAAHLAVIKQEVREALESHQ